MEEDHSAGTGNYQVVARRYRPKNFDELVGQEHIVQALSNAIGTSRIGHAYLFTGARGTGKTTSARIFAKALNCAGGITLTPCGKCDSCISVSTGDDIDVLEIDAASNRGIEEIRQLRQNASIRPSRSRYKIYILDEVHMLTKEAFNALLKILEEPPEHIKFIFCTTEPTKIPITILSRCQRFDFAGIEAGQIVARLASIAENEKVTADDGVFDTLARRAAGSMRDAQSLLEQLLSFAPQHISLADVHEMLGTANDQLLFRLLDNILQNDPVKIFTELDAAAGQGVDFGVLVEQILGLYRDLLVTASGGNAELLLSCTPPQFDQVKKLSAELGLHRILAAMQILDHTHTRMQRSTQGRVLLELALIRIANLDHFQQIAVLLDQLRSGKVAAMPAMTVKPAQRQIPPPKVEFQRKNSGEKITLSDLSEDQAKNVWFDAVDSIDGMLGTAAAKYRQVKLEKPNVFVVVFDNKISKDLCERESGRLQSVLSQTVGEAVRIRFELSVSVPSEPVVAADRSASYQADRERYLAASENPLVLEVQKVFGATFHEVVKKQ